ncbi:hypothetical protein OG874_43380 [Nocardia sp. NBC_00565]|uniref:hypothetical protein n=1 Tax=Nocardia sp. NBC_00565 TaxID=2975993 RepID=UPI002E805F24|nr:hypothetical protein [Nocardia sp. NBC_00565]WUC03422.1 hypothetical protein OG874_43380 [Nocardia sp. NBC_00565]
MTNSDNGFDADEQTRQQLRALDPARSLPPADADALASLLEDTMNQPHTDPTTTRLHRGGPPRTVLIAAAAAAAVLAIATVVTHGDDKPAGHPDTSTAKQTVTALSVGPGVAAKCMPPSAEIVARQAIAFEGKVTNVTDNLVTLEATHFYSGTATDLVTVTKPDLGMSELPVDFQLGQTYVVGATDGHVSICGLSGLATDDLRALYEEAFGK